MSIYNSVIWNMVPCSYDQLLPMVEAENVLQTLQKLYLNKDLLGPWAPVGLLVRSFSAGIIIDS